MRYLLFFSLVLLFACEPDNDTEDQFKIHADSINTNCYCNPIDIPIPNIYNIRYELIYFGQILEYYWLDNLSVEQYVHIGPDKVQTGSDHSISSKVTHDFTGLSNDTLRIRAFNYFDRVGLMGISIYVDSVQMVYAESAEIGIELKVEYILE